LKVAFEADPECGRTLSVLTFIDQVPEESDILRDMANLKRNVKVVGVSVPSEKTPGKTQL
jgi:hypothetical protein